MFSLFSKFKKQRARDIAAFVAVAAVLSALGFEGRGFVQALHGFKTGLPAVEVARPVISSPRVSMTSVPTLSENKILVLSYAASDDDGIREIALRITPHDPSPGANNASVEIVLPVPPSKNIARTDLQDLSLRPWAGQKVELQIVATNDAGKRSLTDAVEFTFPKRHFLHPVARVLIEERAKLMRHPDDETLREEAANIMAGIAHNPSNYHGDPVVLMALRSGAVRLVLGHDREAAISANDLLWEAAARIEDGTSGASQRTTKGHTAENHESN
jgi:hypothetical protein